MSNDDIYPRVNGKWVTYDVKPDPLDLRDREYKPPLISLPPEYPEKSLEILKLYSPLVRDQMAEGACVGFGLAAMINYLRWSRPWRQKLLLGLDVEPRPPKPADSVSPRMLYHLARFYDQIEGENYHGSTCKAAMTGWHKHGVCLEEDWRYSDEKKSKDRVQFVQPVEPQWRERAAECTIGAYYRVKSNSVRDIQAAIYENGAVFASAHTHDGWSVADYREKGELPTISAMEGVASRAHAFALVGFNAVGFILQNSYGQDWGYYGFAILPYGDWIQNGQNVWVAALGVPTNAKLDGIGNSTVKTEALAGAVYRKRHFGMPDPAAAVQEESETDPWDEAQVYQHSVLMNDHGAPIGRIVTLENAKACVKHVCETRILEEDKKNAIEHIVVFAHSGLESEKRAARRASVLGPYFKANGIYPIFLSGRSGFVETLVQMLHLSPPASMYGESLDDAVASLVADKKLPMGEARDRCVEIFCQKFIRPLWTQFKTNGRVAAQRGGAILQVAQRLRDAFKSGFRKQPKVHLVGHSAGAILLGELLTRLRAMQISKGREVPVETCTLLAPACSVNFASQHVGLAVEKNFLTANQVHIDVLSTENELNDDVGGSYNKSLLYLLSHALEDRPRMPMLGLDETWSMDKALVELTFDESGAKEVLEFRELGIERRVHEKPFMHVAVDGGQKQAAHDLFDNDLEIMTRVMLRILGDQPAEQKPKLKRRAKSKAVLDHPLKVLRGF